MNIYETLPAIHHSSVVQSILITQYSNKNKNNN